MNVSLIGCGVVGRGVARALLSPNPVWKEDGLDLRLVRAADRSWEKPAKRFVPEHLRTDDVLAAAREPEADAVVVAIGGVAPAARAIRAALLARKHVVTPNKAVLAERGEELFRLASEVGRELAFEAAVAGGIPILLAAREGYAANRISRLVGILNGTTNYVLTRMEEASLSLEEAVCEAQAKGFAEADPRLDLSGADAAHKLLLLVGLLVRRRISLDAIPTQGIERLRPDDFTFASRWGFGIKGIAFAEVDARGRIAAAVTPALLPLRSALQHIREERNAIHLTGDLVGGALLSGAGAGEGPTASAVLADLIELARARGAASSTPPGGYAARMASARPARMIPPRARRSRYYVRILAQDRPGVLAQVTRVFGEEKISIAAAHQLEGTGEGRKPVPVALLTHETSGDRIARAAERLDRIRALVPPAVVYPVVEPEPPCQKRPLRYNPPPWTRKSEGLSRP